MPRFCYDVIELAMDSWGDYVQCPAADSIVPVLDVYIKLHVELPSPYRLIFLPILVFFSTALCYAVW